MGNIAAIEQLRGELVSRIGDAVISVDAPSTITGSWWLDVTHSGHTATVEYRPNQGFGVSGPHGGYGEGPDVVVQSVSSAADQIVAFLVTARLLEDNYDRRRQDFAATVVEEIEKSLEERFQSLRQELTASIASVTDEVKNLESEVHQLVASSGGNRNGSPDRI